MVPSLQELVLLVPALMFAFTIHELCHGLMAYALGDNTAKRDGRLSLNPIRHIDIIGLLCVIFIGFGWAKPVMVDPGNLKNPKVDMALISVAGPISNFVMAFISLLIVYPLFAMNLPIYIYRVIMTFCNINIVLGVFNMLPIPPLDGSKVLAGILPDSIYYNLPPVGRYGMLILMILMFTGTTSRILGPLLQGIYITFYTFVSNIYGFIM